MKEEVGGDGHTIELDEHEGPRDDELELTRELEATLRSLMSAFFRGVRHGHGGEVNTH